MCVHSTSTASRGKAVRSLNSSNRQLWSAKGTPGRRVRTSAVSVLGWAALHTVAEAPGIPLVPKHGLCDIYVKLGVP